jgi:Icc protein
MNRRSWIRNTGLLTGASMTGPATNAGLVADKPVPEIAHITDVHIREGDDAPNR